MNVCALKNGIQDNHAAKDSGSTLHSYNIALSELCALPFDQLRYTRCPGDTMYPIKGMHVPVYQIHIEILQLKLYTTLDSLTLQYI